jgi:hypothetical protein
MPCWQLVAFLREHGLNVRLFVQQLFSTPVSAFFAMDVIGSAVAVCVLVSVEGRRAGMTHLWAPIVAVVAVGVSLALPLFLSHAGRAAGIGGARGGAGEGIRPAQG